MIGKRTVTRCIAHLGRRAPVFEDFKTQGTSMRKAVSPAAALSWKRVVPWGASLALLLFFAAGAAVQADTLRLDDGRVLYGRLLGSSRTKVGFKVGNKVQWFARSEVVSVERNGTYKAPAAPVRPTVPARPKSPERPQPAAKTDELIWTVAKVMRSDTAPGGGGFQLDFSESGDNPRYVHLFLKCNRPPEKSEMPAFQVVDYRKRAAASLRAYRGGTKPLLVYAADWKKVAGPRLKGYGREEFIDLEPDSRDPADRLAAAIRAGDREKALFLAGLGLDLAAASTLGPSALELAAARDDDLLAELLRTGARPQATGEGGRTLLHSAARGGSARNVALLLGKGLPSDARDAEGATPVHAAAEAGRAKLVEALLVKGGPADAPTKEGLTPLALAAAKGHVDVVTLLLAKGADPNARGRDGKTPLTRAAAGGHKTVVAALLAKGARPADATGAMTLHDAARSGSLALVRALLAKGHGPNAADALGRTPLHLAAASGARDVVAALLSQGAKVGGKDKRGRTPAAFAIAAGQADALRALLAKGAKLPPADPERGFYPLHGAAEGGHCDVLSLLLDRGMEVDARGEADRTPLLCAAAAGQADALRLLLGRKADIYAQDSAWNTALHHAAFAGSRDCAAALVDAGAFQCAWNKDRRTPLNLAKGELRDYLKALVGAPVKGADGTRLHEAAGKGDHDAVTELLDRGANPNVANLYGRTPLDAAAQCGHLDVVKLLVARGARVSPFRSPFQHNDGLYGGDHPLAHAAIFGHKDVIDFLVAKGADPKATDESGRTILHVYCTEPRFRDELALWAIRQGVDPNARDSRGRTPLHLTSQTARVKLLLEHGAKPMARDNAGQTPLCRACRRREAAKLLLEAGADIHAVDNEGRTALHAWLESGYVSEDDLEAFLEHGAKADARTPDGRTPLHFYVEGIKPRDGKLSRGAWAKIRCLIRHGADPAGDPARQARLGPRGPARDRPRQSRQVTRRVPSVGGVLARPCAGRDGHRGLSGAFLRGTGATWIPETVLQV